MATDSDSKKLSDLRVVDLRAELEKRGLDKTGVKASLIEKLQKALVSEGKNPEEYEFEMADKKPVKRLSTSTRIEDQSDQSATDSILQIETQAHDVALEPSQESSILYKKSDGAESPLNLSIGEEEECLLLNSGDEDVRITSSKKTTIDEKTTASIVGPSADSVKDVVCATATMSKVSNDVKEDDDVDLSGEQNNQTDEDGCADLSSLRMDESATSATTIDTTAGGTGGTLSSPNSTTAPSDKENSQSDKDKSKNGKSNPGRSLWVTNLLPSTRAQELKHLLSRYGKVIGAKVVQSSRFPRTRCYGYVTMETRAAADICIEKLNNTELKGQIIRVAKVRPEHSLPLTKSQKKPDSLEKAKKKTPPKLTKSGSSDKQTPDKKKNNVSGSSSTESPVEKINKKDDKLRKEPERERNKSRSSSRKNRSVSKTSSRPAKPDILTFDKIREERERQRQRERERALREEEKRRRELQRTREVEKRQREEAMRLEREREKLRIERERLDRQRVEIMRLERERQKLEREKLEQERQELRRQQLRLEESRRPVKRPSATTSVNYRRDSATYTEDRKRLATERHYEETPPPPRFEVSSRETVVESPKSKEMPKDYKSRMAYSKRTEEYSKRGEFKRDFPPVDRHPTHIVHSIGSGGNTSKYESSAYVNRERDREIREPGRREVIVPQVPPPRISKEARYAERSGERSPVSYRPVRDDREQRRPVSDHHAKGDLRSSREHRYGEVAPSIKETARYRESNSWHTSGAPAAKTFSGMSSSANSSRESWSKTDNWRPMDSASNERWGNSSSRILMSGSSGVPSNLYSGGNSNISGMSTGLSCPPPPGNSSYAMDRFDYKSLTNSRKY